MNKSILLASAFLILNSFAAHAVSDEEFVNLFQKMEKTYKGPFGLNMLQGSKGKCAVKSCGGAPGKSQFQAAYRNSDFGIPLARDYDFWTANLFTSNYYQLVGEFVYGDADSSHPMEAADHEALLANNAAAMVRASSMVRHWVLESHYREHIKTTKYALSFTERGIGSAEIEPTYAKNFFEFFLSSMATEGEVDEKLYLPAQLLISESPVSETASLKQARDWATADYELAKGIWGESSRVTTEFYDIRNAIHNHLSEDIVGMIDAFVAKYPDFANHPDTHPMRIRRIIIDYYAASADVVIAKANALTGKTQVDADIASIVGAAQGLSGALKSDPEQAAELMAQMARGAANLRTALPDQALVPYGSKTDTMVLSLRVSQLLGKEIARMKTRPQSPRLIQALLDLIYVEGYIGQRHLNYFSGKLEGGDYATAVEQLAGAIKTATSSEKSALVNSFGTALDQWILAVPDLKPGAPHSFTDAVIRSSILSTAQILL